MEFLSWAIIALALICLAELAAIAQAQRQLRAQRDYIRILLDKLARARALAQRASRVRSFPDDGAMLVELLREIERLYGS